MGIRILIIDDNPRIHEDYQRVLGGTQKDTTLDALEAELFGTSHAEDGSADPPEYELTFASQGAEAIELLRQALQEDRPFRMAFCDVRMPPGMDGVQTSLRLWELDPDLQVVLCTAFSDYSWEETLQACQQTDRLLVLKKPFDPIEVQQMAASLTAKRDLLDAQKDMMAKLESLVEQRTSALQAEMQQRQQVEVQLRHAQKLEAVGQLAAGVAHEINTPIQFIRDATDFLAAAASDLGDIVSDYRDLLARRAPELAPEARIFEKDRDIDFLLQEAPGAAQIAADGLRKVSETVLAMKSFASERSDHAAAPTDLNEALRTTVAVCASQWRPVADLVLDAGDLPQVTCRVQDMNQVFLQLVLNSVHAIEDADRGPGRIVVESRHADEHVLVRVRDTGCGIPAHLREKVFEPFFTTKEVGRGRGQGLTLVHSVVVEQHGGDVSLHSSSHGTTVELRLPVEGARCA